MSNRISSGLREIERYWTLLDVLEAHLILDAIESAEAEAAKPPGK